MPLIEQSVIEEAKRIDLLSFLMVTNPADLEKIRQNEYRLKSHDSVKINNGLWYQFSTGKGGRTALDYLIKVEGLTFPDAIRKLMEHEPPSIPAQNQILKKRSELLLPKKHINNDAVLKYLVSTRCLDKDIVRDLMRMDLIYESRHKEHTNTVFIGADRYGNPRQASIRGIMSLYKSEAPGSNKHFSFNVPARDNSNTIHIFESAIDLISFMTLIKRYRRQADDHLLSLSGIYQPKTNMENGRVPIAIEQYLTDYAEIGKMILHLDNDIAGRQSSEALKVIISKIGIEVIDKPNPYGKDMNDYLRIRSIEHDREAR